MQTSGTILVHAEFLLSRSKDYSCSSNGGALQVLMLFVKQKLTPVEIKRLQWKH